MSDRRRWLCRVGLHAWYLDCAQFASADRCNRCPAYRNTSDRRLLERERALWSSPACPRDLGRAMGFVASRLYTTEPVPSAPGEEPKP